MYDYFFARAEADYESRLPPESEPTRCPVCGSIDISAGGICRHCNTNIEEVSMYENPFQTENRNQDLLSF